VSEGKGQACRHGEGQINEQIDDRKKHEDISGEEAGVTQRRNRQTF